MSYNLLEVKDLNCRFEIERNLFSQNKYLHVLKNINFKLKHGSTLGIVGESGCGKSTLCRTILSLNIKETGNIIWFNKDIDEFSKKEFKNFRKKVQIIFQDPYASLNPLKNIMETIAEPIKYHRLIDDKNKIIDKVTELLNDVGLDESFLPRYPHELSGGQRQRICIARAICLHPKVIICHECVSALDVSVQATILNLLNSLKKKYDFTYIFISHDLSVVKYMSDRIVVLFNGKVVEYEEADKMFLNPKSNYTKKLIKASI